MLLREKVANVRTIITHADCADGIASAMILRNAIPGAEVRFLHYGSKELAELESSENMLFCDITPVRERAQLFVDAGAIVLDHHKEARDIVEMFGDNGVFADEKKEPGVSGALLAYESVWPLCGVRAQQFATLAGVRDTWQTQDSRWDDACAQASALLFYGADYFLPSRRAWLEKTELKTGHMLIGKRRELSEATARNLYRVGHTYQIAMFNDAASMDGRLISDVAEATRRLPECANIALVVGYFYVVDSNKLKLVVSLRSGPAAPDLDVGALAKLMNGGGHSRAAGFTIDDDGVTPPRKMSNLMFRIIATNQTLYRQIVNDVG